MPERQVALQQGYGLVDGTVGFGCNVQFAVPGAGKLPCAVEPAGTAVQNLGMLGKQLQQGGVGFGAGQQRRGGSDHPDIVGRHIACQIHHTARQRDRREERKTAAIGFVLRKIHQTHTRGLQQHLHHR